MSIGYLIAAAINLTRCVAYYASIPFPFEYAAVAISLLMPAMLILIGITMLRKGGVLEPHLQSEQVGA